MEARNTDRLLHAGQILPECRETHQTVRLICIRQVGKALLLDLPPIPLRCVAELSELPFIIILAVRIRHSSHIARDFASVAFLFLV